MGRVYIMDIFRQEKTGIDRRINGYEFKRI